MTYASAAERGKGKRGIEEKLLVCLVVQQREIKKKEKEAVFFSRQMAFISCIVP